MPLRVNGHVFQWEDGGRATICECSDFNLYARYLRHEDDLVAAVLDERQAIGFEFLRVWLLYDVLGIGYLHPHDHPDFYAQLDPFTRLLATRGLRPEFTIFTGTSRLMPDRLDQQRHFDFSMNALPRGVALFELVNENDQGDNAIDDRLIYQNTQILSGGSVSSDTWPIERGRMIRDYEVLHLNPADEWQRKSGHECMEMSLVHSVPAFTNEGMRCPDRDRLPHHFHDAAASGVLLSAGAGCFHSVSGKQSTLFTPDERACAQAFVQGAASVPLEFQGGRYTHAASEEGPDDLRIYRKTLPDGRSWTVRVRR